MPTRRRVIDAASEASEQPVMEGVFPEIPPDGTEGDLGASQYEATAETTPTANLGDMGYGEDGAASEVTPTRRIPRASTAGLFSLLWGGVGMGLTTTQADIPVGRVLQLQAPLAGKKLDAAIAGSWLDRTLQPFVKVAEGAEGFGALILFPLLIGITERQPEMYPALYPIIRQVAEVSIGEIGPEMAKERKKAARNVAAVSNLANDLGIKVEEGQDPIDVFLSSLFAMPQPQPQTGDTENEV